MERESLLIFVFNVSLVCKKSFVIKTKNVIPISKIVLNFDNIFERTVLRISTLKSCFPESQALGQLCSKSGRIMGLWNSCYHQSDDAVHMESDHSGLCFQCFFLLLKSILCVESQFFPQFHMIYEDYHSHFEILYSFLKVNEDVIRDFEGQSSSITN